MQTTNHLLMIRPVDFKFNQQTAENNKFQQESGDANTQSKALYEFDAFVAKLRENLVDVTVINDTIQPEKPDSIFPNNWISFHDTGETILYPMFSENRRLERRQDILDQLGKNFVFNKTVDLTRYERDGVFLEGTGSLVLDRVDKVAYACRSLRTNELVIAEFCNQTGYTIVLFDAVDAGGFPIYHTNVMMCVGEQFAVICLEAISNDTQKTFVVNSLTSTGKEIIEISLEQMNRFAGNMLQVTNKNRDRLLVMSEQAYLSLSVIQIERLSTYNKIVTAPLYTIEKNGGGSARCMLAEIHLKRR